MSTELAIPVASRLVRLEAAQALEVHVREVARDMDLEDLVPAAEGLQRLVKSLVGTRPAPHVQAASNRIRWQIGELLGPPPGQGAGGPGRESVATDSEIDKDLAYESRLIRWELDLDWDADEMWRPAFRRLLGEAKRVRAERVLAELAIEPPKLYEGSFVEQLAHLRDVDVILCDPPYGEQWLPLYADLAEWSLTVLSDHGVLAVMTGQMYLPIVMQMFGKLRYRWTLAYLTPGGQAVQIFPRKINTFWKPVLLYGADRDWLGDVARSPVNDNDKRHHEWGQSVSGTTDLLRRLVQPGDLVCDPVMGAGTTAFSAAELGCRFVGCDLDRSTAVARLPDAVLR